ncbi:hypothetical protein ACJ41O_013093 [Fusarium nematophilum]
MSQLTMLTGEARVDGVTGAFGWILDRIIAVFDQVFGDTFDGMFDLWGFSDMASEASGEDSSDDDYEESYLSSDHYEGRRFFSDDHESSYDGRERYLSSDDDEENSSSDGGEEEYVGAEEVDAHAEAADWAIGLDGLSRLFEDA